MDKIAVAKIQEKVRAALEKARDAGVIVLESVPDIVVEMPNNPENGDFASNVALKLAKELRMPPMKIAGIIIEHMEASDPLVGKVVVAKPGFINFFMKEKAITSVVGRVLSEGNRYGGSDLGKRMKINVEFVSSNPTGPLTIGHGRQATIGDVLSNALSFCGYDVTREYYYNDAGNQMNMLGASVHARYKQLFDASYPFLEEGYQGEYIRDLAKDIQAKEGEKFVGKDDQDTVDFFRTYAAREMIALIDKDLKDYGIRFDVWARESALYDDGKVDRAIELLRKHEHIYEHDGAVWFASSKLGDEKDRVVVRSNGDKTYFAGDIAYHMDKHERGFDRAIDIWGADHHGYVPRMMAVIRALGYPDDFLECIVHQMVSFVRDGREIRMSTRAGEFITLNELVHEIGLPATRFFFVMRSVDSHLVFDLDLAKKESNENPVYYIQYAHARISSIAKHAQEKNIDLDAIARADLLLLTESEEIEMMKQMARFPAVVEATAERREVHRIPTFILEMVGLFHGYYNKHRVVSDDEQLTLARLALVEAARQVIKNALNLLGIEAPERM